MNHLYYIDKETGLIVLTPEGKDIYDDELKCESCTMSLSYILGLQNENERLQLELDAITENTLELIRRMQDGETK